MHIEIKRKLHEHSKNFKKELENIKKNQKDVKNIITENLKYMIRNQGFPDD